MAVNEFQLGVQLLKGVGRVGKMDTVGGWRKEVNKMSVAKVIEIVGSSSKSWEEAVKEAVSQAAKTIRNIRGVEVVGMTGIVEEGKIVEYRATVKIAFGVER